MNMTPWMLGFALAFAALGSARAADPVPLYKEGIAAKKAGDDQRAEERFRACLAADPKYGRCHFSLGVLLKKKDALSDAETHFRKALEAHPTWGQAHFSLGMTLVKKGDPVGAKGAFEAAIADPDLEADDRAEAWNALGVMHRQAGRLKEAVAAYDQAIAALPRKGFHQNKAVALEHLEDYAAMEFAARAAIAMDGADASSWILLSRALSLARRLPEALPAWTKATELAPQSAEAFWGLGESAEAAGKKDIARQAFERYLALAPPGTDRGPIERRIEKNR